MKRVLLKSRPMGGLPLAENFELVEVDIPNISDGEVLVKTIYISIDPAMRGWMNAGKSYIKPVEIGEVFRAGTAGIVADSKHPDFKKGDAVIGGWGVQEYANVEAKTLTRIVENEIPLHTYISTLGMPGMTAYFGLLDTGLPKEGETVLVSAASGAVGSVVGQIAKIKGCKVIGLAGSDEKCDYVINELGFDDCINYKTKPLKEQLKNITPEGIDVFFDNVGGDILDIVLTHINKKARIVICGAISQYNNTTPVKGPSNYLSLLVNSAKMEGIVVFDNAQNYPKAVSEMSQWIKEGKLKEKVDIQKGIENFHSTLLKLFEGKNFGKLILEV
jgi:NADPH-dependent curcumin reductase